MSPPATSSASTALRRALGLHPVAVIFAVLAGGELFGFLGVLLALPVASVVMVLLRYAHRRYTASDLYRSADEPVAVAVGGGAVSAQTGASPAVTFPASPAGTPAARR